MPSRRSHRKSRNGCLECKKRRVKCNEQHPCQTCHKCGIRCTYNPYVGPTKPQAVTTVDPSSAASGQNLISPANDVIRTSALVVGKSSWIRDLELMHHFASAVCKTLSERKGVQDVWSIIFPQEAYSCDFLMHGILAFSALHLSFLKTQDNGDYIGCSAHHLHCALSTYRKALPNIASDNCIASFALSSLFVVHFWALPIVDESGPSVEKVTILFGLCRGVETILAPYKSLIRGSRMKALLCNDYLLINKLPRTSHVNSILPEHLEDRLSRLKELITNYPLEPDKRTVYAGALNLLKISFDFIEKVNAPLECGMAFVWPIMLQDEFIGFLREYQSLSLVLLSYYCIILNRLDKFWFLRGWDKVLLTEIWNRLPPELQTWVEWPKAVCYLQ